MSLKSRTAAMIFVSLLSGCGANDHNRAQEGQSHVQSETFISNLAATSQEATQSTMGMIQADQYRTLALFHRKASWTTFFNDRFSLTTAGSPVFPAFHGGTNYLPSLFHTLAPLGAIKPLGNSLTCNSEPNRPGCQSGQGSSVCQDLLADFNLRSVSNENIANLYFYLTGYEASADDVALLNKIAVAAASSQSIYTNPLEVVCFSIMQTAAFLTL